MDTTKVPTTFWVVAALALVWNLIGVAMFFLQTNMGPEQIAALPPEQQQIYAVMPAWLDIPYGVAVFGGVLGSLALLLRRRWAVAAFAVSLLAVVVQMAGVYALTPAWAVSGASGLPMTLLIVAIAGFLVWYANRAAARGWLR
ncbi:hypothetical protein H0E84_11275 [Luteimonas sp. SJ-92]|uniref:Sugar transporter n=1 Tax=Luteimonas salinisoli TaxID=2752307 RepID=A0A853JCH0_9GAMM|nr:hypothetical protein [Luteimonas salinisoli]NZA26963.1 hypothetical protein [Luteimonas salinisoli]